MIVAVVVAVSATALAAADPLPSWQDGATKTAIMEFVAKVTQEGGPDFVPPAERIATFDNDGTLWAEQPTAWSSTTRWWGRCWRTQAAGPRGQHDRDVFH